MLTRERANTIRHWLQSARDHLERAETYDPFEPNMPAAERDRLYAGWRRAVDRARRGPPSGEPAADD